MERSVPFEMLNTRSQPIKNVILKNEIRKDQNILENNQQQMALRLKKLQYPLRIKNFFDDIYFLGLLVADKHQLNFHHGRQKLHLDDSPLQPK